MIEACLFYSPQRFFVATSRQLKRLESISRSPIYTHFQESLQGATSIRAYHQRERFIEESERRVDYNLLAYYPSLCANRSVGIGAAPGQGAYIGVAPNKYISLDEYCDIVQSAVLGRVFSIIRIDNRNMLI